MASTQTGRSAWNRRTLLSAGAAAGLGGLTGCSSDDSQDPDDEVKKKVEQPPDNLKNSGFPIVKDPVTLHFMTGKPPNTAKDYNDVASWQKYQKMTNMKINWGLEPVDGLDEKRNLSLSGGDYPEAFYAAKFSPSDVGKYGSQGVFIKLNTLIDKYMPNLKKLIDKYQQVKRGLTFPDGGIYSMPVIHDPTFLGVRIQFKLWVRRDWLDKFDMDIPRTTDEYYRYLKSVKTRNPNRRSDAVGYGGYHSADWLAWALMGSFGIGNRGKAEPHIDADSRKSDQVRFFPITDEYKALLEYLHKLYSEGLMNKNIFSMDAAKFRDAASKGVYGSNVATAPGSSYGGKANNFVPVPALKGPAGHHNYNFMSSMLQNIGTFVITNKNKHPVATARWMDYFYSAAGSKLFFMGVEGKSYKKTKHGVEYLDKIADNRKGLTEDEALKPYTTYMGGGYPGLVMEKYFKGTESSKESTKAAKLLDPDKQDVLWPAFTYTRMEFQKLSSLSADIDKYVDESRAKFINGETSLDDWKKYVNKIRRMGLEEYLEIKQNAYDRYRKK